MWIQNTLLCVSVKFVGLYQLFFTNSSGAPKHTTYVKCISVPLFIDTCCSLALQQEEIHKPRDSETRQTRQTARPNFANGSAFCVGKPSPCMGRILTTVFWNKQIFTKLFYVAANRKNRSFTTQHFEARSTAFLPSGEKRTAAWGAKPGQCTMLHSRMLGAEAS